MVQSKLEFNTSEMNWFFLLLLLSTVYVVCSSNVRLGQQKGSSCIPGMPGPKGLKGFKGKKGKPGIIGGSGIPGPIILVDCTIARESFSRIRRTLYSNDETCRGRPGPPGEPGQKGNRGVTGMKGARGPPSDTACKNTNTLPLYRMKKSVATASEPNGPPTYKELNRAFSSIGLPGLPGVRGSVGVTGNPGFAGPVGLPGISG